MYIFNDMTSRFSTTLLLIWGRALRRKKIAKTKNSRKIETTKKLCKVSVLKVTILRKHLKFKPLKGCVEHPRGFLHMFGMSEIVWRGDWKALMR